LPQGRHVPPPQSVSVSLAFFTSSPHEGVVQMLSTQFWPAQSALLSQRWVSVQVLQDPPQSMSDSPGSFWPLVQGPGTMVVHTCWLVQTPPVQSASMLHFLPSSQRLQVGPPQSTSDST